GQPARRARGSGGLGRSRQPSTPVRALWTAKTLPGRRFPVDRPRIRDSSSRRIFVSGSRGPGGMTEHDHLDSAARQTAAQDRRHDRGGGAGGLGARPPPRSTPPPRQRWWCWRSWGKAAIPLNTATLELAAVLSFPGGATPCNAIRKERR